MKRRIFYRIFRYALTKATFLVAVIFFARQLKKTLKNTDMQKEVELKEKSKNIVTGSIEDIPGETIEKDKKLAYKDLETKTIKSTVKKVSPGEVEEILQNLLDVEWDEEAMQEICTPSYMLALDSDVEYLYSLSRKTFVPVKNNITVIPINIPGQDVISNNLSKNFSYFSINNEIFDIDHDKVVCIGWN